MRFSLSIRNRLILTVVLIILGLGAQSLVNNAAQHNIDYLQKQQADYLSRDASISVYLNNLIVETNNIIKIELEDYLTGVLQNTNRSQIQALDLYEVDFKAVLTYLLARNQTKYTLDPNSFSDIPYIYDVDAGLINQVEHIVDTTVNGTYRTASFIQINIRNVVQQLHSEVGTLKERYIDASQSYYGNYSSYVASLEIVEDHVFNLQKSILTSNDFNYVKSAMAVMTDLSETLHHISQVLVDYNLSFLQADATKTNYTSVNANFNADMQIVLDNVTTEFNNMENFGLVAADQSILDNVYSEFNTTLVSSIPQLSNSVQDFVDVRTELGLFQKSQFVKSFQTAQKGITMTKQIFDTEHQKFLEVYSQLQKETITSAQNTILLFTALLGGIVFALAIPVIFRISLSTRRLERNFRRVSSGDLSFTIKDVSANDEFGNLEKSFNQLVLNLKDIVGVIQQSSAQLAGISEELAAGTEEASASLTSISDTVRTIAIGAQNQNNLIEGLRGNMFDLRKEIQVATSGIQQASNNVTKLAQRTNILGLNASISAAKAGGTASGFGIVAGEIRELAINSRKSSGEISELVEEITNRLRVLSNAITEDLEQVRNVASTTAEGSSITNSTTDEQVIMLNEISTTSNDLADLANNLDVLLSQFKL